MWTRAFLIVLAIAATACGGSSGTDGKPAPSKAGTESEDPVRGSDDVGEAGAAGAPPDAGARGPGEPSGNVDANMTTRQAPTMGTEAGVAGAPRDAATIATDARTGAGDASADPLTDSGELGAEGSCCEARDTPGCGNADLEVCVCEKDPSCCTKAWGSQCVIIVAQKYCQPRVRVCVCGSAEGQWNQARCCEKEWSASCDSVAKLKCDAAPGCF